MQPVGPLAPFQDAPGERVHLGEQVREVAALGAAGVLRVRDRRDVHLGVGQVDVERLVVVLGARDEVDRALGDLPVEAGAELRVVGADRFGLLTLLAGVDGLQPQRDLRLADVRGRVDRTVGEVGLHRP